MKLPVRGEAVVKRSLYPNDYLAPNDVLAPFSSPNHPSYELVFRTDGNVVLYERPSNKEIWATGTAGKKADRFVMGTDHRLRLFDGKTIIWESPDRQPPKPSAAAAFAVVEGHGAVWIILPFKTDQSQPSMYILWTSNPPVI